MYHGSKVIAKNLFRLLPMSAILDFVITKMPSGCNHYTHLIRKLHGIETPKMQRRDCYQAKQCFEEILACATRLKGSRREGEARRVFLAAVHGEVAKTHVFATGTSNPQSSPRGFKNESPMQPVDDIWCLGIVSHKT